MRTLDEFDRFELMAQPRYGRDCYGDPITPENGYSLIDEGDTIQKGDKPWDVFAGWMESDGYHARNQICAQSRGRWTTWERKTKESQ